MASGKDHAKVNRTIFYCTAVAAVVGFPAIGGEASAGLILGSCMGVMATPDLDSNGKTFEEKRMIRRFGVFGHLWYLYWLPYAKFFKHSRLKKDRSALRDWSHRHVLGTLTRFVYILWLPMLLAVWIGVAGIAAMFFAWTFQDSAHIIQDKLQTKYRPGSQRWNS